MPSNPASDPASDPSPGLASARCSVPAPDPAPGSSSDPVPGLSEDVRQARAYFPRGLTQAEGAFRFSADALLLAAFAAQAPAAARAAELGTGCGAAAFGYLLRLGEAARASDPKSEPRVLGLDIHAPSLAAARENAARLGLAERFTALAADVRRVRQEPSLPAEGFDLVLANPPYRRPGTGRVCPDPARTAARFETDAGLDDFLDATAYLLANRAPAVFVFLAGRLPELLAGLTNRRLAPRRLCCVHGRADAPARLVLVEARKNGRSELVVEPPLILYEERAGRLVLTAAARAFCPWLACNAERPRSGPSSP